MLWPGCLFSQNHLPRAGCSETYYRYVVRALAHDSMEGRLPGTAGEKKSAAFIKNEMQRIGCRPLEKQDFLLPFTFYNPDSVLISSAGNVIGVLGSKGKKYLIIGAHYDHLGMGLHHSRSPFSKSIHNGADDNASGVAIMLSLAAELARSKAGAHYRMIFVAFSAEEDGLWGSKDLLSGRYIDTAAICRYINLDMVGRLNNTAPILKTEGLLEHPELEAFLPPDASVGFQLRKADPIFIAGSDNYTFEAHHIPGLSFSTGVTEQYHRPDDDADLINYSGMVRIAKYVSALINKMRKE